MGAQEEKAYGSADPDPELAPQAAEQRKMRDLVAGSVRSARHGAMVAIAGSAEAQHWTKFEGLAYSLISQRKGMAGADLADLGNAIADRAHRCLRDRTRTAAYQAFLRDVDDRRRVHNLLFGETEGEWHTHQLVIWFTIWHLVAAGVSLARIGRVLSAKPRRQPGQRGVPLGRLKLGDFIAQSKIGASRVSARVGALQRLNWKPKLSFADIRQKIAPQGAKMMAQGAARAAIIGRRLAATGTKIRRNMAAGLATYQELRQRQVEKDLASDRCTAEWLRQAQEKETARVAEAAGASARTAALDAQRLSGSLIPTWLALVALSWVSLFWGTLISMPFGVGVALAMSFSIGIFAVPLWGTIWGLIGMSAAKASTLRELNFAPVEQGSYLHVRTRLLAERLGIRTPQVGVVPARNAFAIGVHRDDAAIAIGGPLLDTLPRDQIDAIIAHELGHVVSGDMQRMVLMRTFQNATVWFAMFQGMKQFARWVICWVAELYILAFSRRREFWADAIGASLTSKEAMIGALHAMERAPQVTDMERRHARFMFHTVFSTHPSIAARIQALEDETYIRRLPVK